MSTSTVCSDDPSLEHNFRGHKNTINSVSFSPDNKYLASGSSDNSILIWNYRVKSARCFNFVGHKDHVLSIDFSPDGRLLASASQDQTVRLWIPTITGKCVEFKPHLAPIRSVAFSPDGGKLVTGANDKAVKIFEVNRRKFITSFSTHTNWVKCARFSPDNNVVASCSDDKTVRLWDSRSGNSIHIFTHIKGSPNYIAFHPTSTALAAAMSNGGIRIYDLTANKLRQNYLLHDNTTSLAWHPNGNYLLTCGNDAAIRVLDALQGHPLYTLKSHTKSVNSIAFSKTGDLFASGGADKHVMIWKTNFIEKCEEKENDSSIE